jgi:hypothetical protein
VNQEAVEKLVSRLLAARKTTPAERLVIAEMADRGAFDAPEFVARCVRTGEPPFVMWRAVKDWASSSNAAGLSDDATRGLRAQGYDETDPPLDAEHLQVVLELDDPKGWVVARWRDLYADHGQALEVDMCLEHLTDQRLCWDCGDLGVTERDDVFSCAVHLEKKKEQ